MAVNADLQKAKNEKRDEFYTQLEDIEAELGYYTEQFKDKIVYCNCDDPAWSNFWKYFDTNFDVLGLKGLIATYYVTEGVTYKLEAMRDEVTGERLPPVRIELASNGDFRSQECIDILDACDIVVTNPPFSLFREYVRLLFDHGKKFLIIGNVNAITYRDFFPLLKDNKVWLGPSITSGDRKFNVPDDYPLKAAGCGIDEDGRRFIRVKGVRWFTNLDHGKRHEALSLSKSYSQGEYFKYANRDAINVDKVKDIPSDYFGVMGVPITFLDKYRPEQFEIVSFRKGDDGKDLVYMKDGQKVQPYIRILVRRR